MNCQDHSTKYTPCGLQLHKSYCNGCGKQGTESDQTNWQPHPPLKHPLICGVTQKQQHTHVTTLELDCNIHSVVPTIHKCFQFTPELQPTSDPTKVCLCSYHYQRSKTTNHCVKVLITATHLSEWKQKMSHNTRTKLLWKVWHPTPYSLPRCLTTLASLQWLAELQGTSKAQLSVSLLYTEACPPRRPPKIRKAKPLSDKLTYLPKPKTQHTTTTTNDLTKRWPLCKHKGH